MNEWRWCPDRTATIGWRLTCAAHLAAILRRCRFGSDCWRVASCGPAASTHAAASRLRNPARPGTLALAPINSSPLAKILIIRTNGVCLHLIFPLTRLKSHGLAFLVIIWFLRQLETLNTFFLSTKLSSVCLALQK